MEILNRISNLMGNREQRELTNYLGINSVAFSEWKSGKSKSYRKYLIEIAEFFDVSIDYLVYGKEKSPKSELSDLELELLEKFNMLLEVDKGRILDRMETIYDSYSPELKERAL